MPQHLTAQTRGIVADTHRFGDDARPRRIRIRLAHGHPVLKIARLLLISNEERRRHGRRTGAGADDITGGIRQHIPGQQRAQYPDGVDDGGLARPVLPVNTRDAAAGGQIIEIQDAMRYVPHVIQNKSFQTNHHIAILYNSQ